MEKDTKATNKRNNSYSVSYYYNCTSTTCRSKY